MARNDLNQAQDAVEIDIRQLMGGLSKKWWRILLISVVFAAVGFLISYFTYTPTYTSTTTFVVSNRTNAGIDQADSLTSSDLSASTTLANTFKYILLSDEAMHSIIGMYKLDDSIEGLKNSIRITPVANTNILQMSVVTTDAILSRDIADRIIDYYPAVLDRTLKSASLEVLNSPRAAATPDSYNGFVLYPLLGLISALILSVALVYLRLVFSDRLKTTSDISSKLNVHVMASIPKVETGEKKKKHAVGLLISDKSSGFVFTESFKALRTRVESVANKKGYKTFVVSSTLENEGKTTVAVNLSIALAGNGKKVLLIDADLRKPAICKYLGLSEQLAGRGIDSVLNGDASLEAAIWNVEKFGLSVLLGIREIYNSSELLSSSRMKDLIASVSEQYDYIIIDSSPASVLTDPAVITCYTDAVIFVLRQDYTSAALAGSVVQSLSENRAELVGCILNIADEKGIGGRFTKYGKYGRYGKYRKYSSYDGSRRQNSDLEQGSNRSVIAG